MATERILSEIQNCLCRFVGAGDTADASQPAWAVNLDVADVDEVTETWSFYLYSFYCPKGYLEPLATQKPRLPYEGVFGEEVTAVLKFQNGWNGKNEHRRWNQPIRC